MPTTSLRCILVTTFSESIEAQMSLKSRWISYQVLMQKNDPKQIPNRTDTDMRDIPNFEGVLHPPRPSLHFLGGMAAAQLPRPFTCEL